MRQLRLTLALLASLFLCVPLLLQAESAGSLYKKGKDAEAAQKYETAYDYYKQAHDKDPKDLRFRTAFERTRFYAAAVKVHRGQILREGGRLEDALEQFEAAAAIDPSMDIAQQELRLTRRLIDEAKQQPTSQQNEQQSQGPLSQLLQQAQGPVELQPISDAPITLKMTQDSKMVYETIGKLAGINVLFDPQLQQKRIQIELNGVSLQDALKIVAFESRTFWRPVTSNTIFIADDNQSKRNELEQSVVKTFYLSNVSQQTDLQDVKNVLSLIANLTKSQTVLGQNAVVVRGTPDQVALAEKLIDDLDKPKPEVVVEIAIMQVNRDRSRNLGISPPTNFSVALQGVNTNSSNNQNQNNQNQNQNQNQNTTSNLTFNTFKHLGTSSYAVTLPPAKAQFLFTDSDSRVIQNPELRAVTGQKATLKIGDRIPFATGSFGNPFAGSTVGGTNFSGLVNTQFQYQDVGVKIDITPTVHANDEVTLKINMEISSVTSTTNIGGIDEPVIGQRTVENEIRLREGEINMMGGIFEDQDVKTWSGIPGLGNIPLFRYLFAQQSLRKTQNEIVFVLIPHIVRRQEVTPFNKTELEVGTQNQIELRRSVKPQQPAQQPPPNPAQPTQQAPQQQPTPQPPAPTTPRTMGAVVMPSMQPATTGEQSATTGSPTVTPAMPMASAPGTESQPAQQNANPAAQVTPPNGGVPSRALPQNPTSDTGAAPPSARGNATVRLDPALISQAVGSTAVINVLIDSGAPVHDFSMEMKYDPAAMQLINVSSGGFLSQDGQPATEVHRADNGVLHAGVVRPPSAPGIPGRGSVLTLTFLLTKPGDYVLAPTTVAPKDVNGVIPASVAGQTAIKVLAAPQR